MPATITARGTATRVVAIITGLITIFIYVSSFWLRALYHWWITRSPRDELFHQMNNANSFEEWIQAAIQQDRLLDYELWRQNPTSKFYDYELIYDRMHAIVDAEDDMDILISALRSGLIRNLGNITAPKLFTRAYTGTKVLIERYITNVVLAIDDIVNYPVSRATGFTNQAKLDLLHDTRQSFGRSALVLQGGAIFGLCHIGVVKALHLRGLLPRIISGTATGALIAALVGVHTEEELPEFLKGSSINVTAFTKHLEKDRAGKSDSWWETLFRRVNRFFREGYFLDVGILEQVLQANVGDLTFQEAYTRTKRILNITVSTTGDGVVPNVLNYLTAPNVLIRSAALISNATDSALYEPVTLLCKDEHDNVVPWSQANETTFKPWTHTSYHKDARDSPLHRIAELFNVNNFIISQAQPYLAPFLRADLHRPHQAHSLSASWSLCFPVLRLMVMEVQHRLRQLDKFNLLSPALRRFLLDEPVPGLSLAIVPEWKFSDAFRLLEHPTTESLNYWILRGERSVWPLMSALYVRCAIEFELDRAYQLVRRPRRTEVNRAGEVAVRRPRLTEINGVGEVVRRRPRPTEVNGMGEAMRTQNARGMTGSRPATGGAITIGGSASARASSGASASGREANERKRRAASFGGELGG